MTSSGLTHACALQYPFGLCETILSTIMTSKYNRAFYPNLNFGTVEIDWDARPFVVKLQVRDFNGTLRIEQRITDEGKPAPALNGVSDCLNDWSNVSFLVRWRLERWVFLGLVGGASGLIVLFGIVIAVLSGKKNKKKLKTQ